MTVFGTRLNFDILSGTRNGKEVDLITRKSTCSEVISDPLYPNCIYYIFL